MNLWLKDPGTDNKSVSVTVLVITLVLALAAIALEIAGVTHTLSGALEIYYAALANYYGKKWFSKNGAIEVFEKGKE